MKNLISLGLMVLILGTSVLALDITGLWSADLSLLPGPGVDKMMLELASKLNPDWTIKSTSIFEGPAFTSQKFEAVGSFGPLTVEAEMAFSPIDVTILSIRYVIPDSWSGLGYDLRIQDGLWQIAGPSYTNSELKASLLLSGLGLSLSVAHTASETFKFDADDWISEYLFYLDFPRYLISDDGSLWVLQPHPTQKPLVVPASGAPYPKYFRAYSDIKLVATKVTFSGYDLGGNPVTHTLYGAFEVYYLDASTGTVILTDGADMYLWYYIAEYGAAHGWDLGADITYDIALEDITVYFMFPSYMSYTFSLNLDPVEVELVLDDVCTGIQFSTAKLALKNLGLCCGITFDAELGFSKVNGFDYLVLESKNMLQLCCGITLDAKIKFTTTSKDVSLKPRLAGFAEGCFTAYADVNFANWTWSGIELYGWRIRCDLAECNYFEILTALRPELFWLVDEELLVNPEEIPPEGVPVFNPDEFEYVKLGFCGPACCGGKYKVDIVAYFSRSGGLFGLSRMNATLSLPLMDNLTVRVALSSEPALKLGWTFRF